MWSLPSGLSQWRSARCLALVSGCGGGTTKDRVKGLAPSEILRQSTAAAAGLSAFHVAVDATVAADVAPGTLPKLFAQALSDPVTITGEGPVNGDAASFDFDANDHGTAAAPGQRHQGRRTSCSPECSGPTTGWTFPGRRWRPSYRDGCARGLLSWATAPTEVGRETVDGAKTVHLAATVDTARALTDIAPALQAIQGTDVVRRRATAAGVRADDQDAGSLDRRR